MMSDMHVANCVRLLGSPRWLIHDLPEDERFVEVTDWEPCED